MRLTIRGSGRLLGHEVRDRTVTVPISTMVNRDHLLHVRHLMEQHGLGEKLFAAQTAMFDELWRLAVSGTGSPGWWHPGCWYSW